MAGEIKLGVESADAGLEVMNKRAIAKSRTLPGYYLLDGAYNLSAGIKSSTLIGIDRLLSGAIDSAPIVSHFTLKRSRASLFIPVAARFRAEHGTFTEKLGLKPRPSRTAFLDWSIHDRLIYVRHNSVKCWYLRQNLRAKSNSMKGLMKPFVLLDSFAILASDTGWTTRRLGDMN
jgi:hypothetical protein